MKRTALLIAIAFILVPLCSYAQPKPVTGQITDEMISEMRKAYQKSPDHELKQNIITNNEITDLALNRDVIAGMDKNFTHVIRKEGVTDQQSSGRCWIFAGLNIIRYGIAEKISDPDFELSQSFSFFWHKLELANTFFENVIATRNKPHHDREIEWLFKHAVGDGGYWNMVVTTINKYGVVPKSIFPESKNTESTSQINKLLEKLVLKHAAAIRDLARQKKPVSEMRAYKSLALTEVYKLLALSLGVPPESFKWRYEKKSDDKKKGKSKSKKPLTKYETYSPKGFLETWSDIKLTDYIRLVNDPSKPFYMRYRIKWTKNAIEDINDAFVNIPMDEMIEYTKMALLKDQPVWFACDVGKQRDWDKGILKSDLMEYKKLFGIDFGMSKADRIRTYNSAANHAMVFTGFDLDDEGTPVKWLVENSWGSDKTSEDGYWIMYTDWFRDFVLEVIINKDILSKDIVRISKSKPVELKPWDPMW